MDARRNGPTDADRREAHEQAMNGACASCSPVVVPSWSPRRGPT